MPVDGFCPKVRFSSRSLKPNRVTLLQVTHFPCWKMMNLKRLTLSALKSSG